MVLPSPSGLNSARLLLVPYAQDPLTLLSERIVQATVPPDLNRVVVLIPELQAVPRLRACLLDEARRQGCDALLGPEIDTLQDWIERHTPLKQRVISQHARELLLVEALMQYPGLFGEGMGNPWRLAKSLIGLFDELTLHRIDLPDDLEQFTYDLARAYGLKTPTLSGLGREAKVVHTLWTSWREELYQEGVLDKPGAYLFRLSRSLEHIDPATQFYLSGFHALLPAELAWSKALYERGQLTLIAQGQCEAGIMAQDYHPDAPLKGLLDEFKITVNPTTDDTKFTQFINSVYCLNGPSLEERARHYAQVNPISPVTGRMRVLKASGAEQEACAIDIQVRAWLLEGKQTIGIVTEDRRLARRVRALLERAGIPLQDAAGWALSTTSAATAVERWLQAVEEDFAHLPLLDLLKSPFVFPSRDRDGHLAIVYRFEQDIILHENVGRSLARYRQHLKYRQQRLPSTFAETGHRVASLLDELEQAALPLLPLIGGNKHRPEILIEALHESLHTLGMLEALMGDAAGTRIVEVLEAMRHALASRGSLRMSWMEFRAWLGHSLEYSNFCPLTTDSPVQLMGLAQTPLCRFDAIVIAGADREHLPGAPETSPFFNRAVARELGLPTARDVAATRLHHFRRLLECAPQVLVTVRREHDGEEIIPSPWLEALQSFHWLAYRDRIEDEILAAWSREPGAQVFHSDTTALPRAQTYPRPAIDPRLVPRTLSVTAQQEMLDCPYQFFIARCLKLAPVEAIREALQKSDYGERVHRVLQAFHQGFRDLPGPFAMALTAETRDAAEQLLREISYAVFARDLEDNFIHRGWLKRWLAIIPGYIDWQMEREQEWEVAACEVVALRDDFAPTLVIRGRLDRIDRKAGGLSIIDYKSGAASRQEEIETGEDVQLALYALLAEGLHTLKTARMERIERVEYLLLDIDKVKAGARLEGESLHTLKERVGERLKLIMQALHEGAALPAWGDQRTCARCKMQGLCRKQAWVTVSHDDR